MNYTLGICIPTYNRADILFSNIFYILDEIRQNNIALYISDDSSNDKTEILFNKYFKKEKRFYYHRNNPSYGHDINCYQTISLVKEDYIWYLGDSVIIEKNAIAKILNILNTHSPSILSFNCKKREGELPPTNLYTNDKHALKDLAWHLTMTGASIYKKSDLNFDLKSIINYKNFPQLALIFIVLSKKGNLYWFNEDLILINSNKKSYWSGNETEVFITDFKNTLVKLPNSFQELEIDKVVIQHSKITKIFNYKYFVKLKCVNKFNRNNYNFNKDLYLIHSDCNIRILYILSILPTFPFKWLLFFFKKK